MSQAPAVPIRVALVEDDPGVRESLEILINGAHGFRCISTHPTGEDALQDLPVHPPEVVLMDIQLPGMSGIDCVRHLKAAVPGLQVMMLTVFDDDERVFAALSSGATGYVLKRTPPAELLDAIAEVHRGGSPMSSGIARRVVQSFHRPAASAAVGESLSPREEEILTKLTKGYRYKEIADQLSISIDTVRSHIRHIYEKLQVHSRTEAVVRFLQPPKGTG